MTKDEKNLMLACIDVVRNDASMKLQIRAMGGKGETSISVQTGLDLIKNLDELKERVTLEVITTL